MEFEDALLEIGWKNLDKEDKRFRDIENKAFAVITISGILMTFLVRLEGSSEALFMLTSLFFLVTVALSVLALWTRGYDTVSTRSLIEDLKDKEKKLQIRGIISTIAKSEESLRSLCDAKVKWLRLSVYGLSLSVALLILYSASVFLQVK